MDDNLDNVKMRVERFILEPFEEKLLEQNVNEIFHYTTAEGLKGILDSGYFFASRSDFLNDYTEMQYCWSLVLELVNSLKEKSESANERIFYDEVKQEIETFRTEIDELEEMFIISFTKNRDSLAMWSHYSDNDGYNIALNLKPNIKMWKEILKTVDFRYGAVIYNVEKQKEILKKEISKALSLWKEIRNTDESLGFFVVDALEYRIKIWTMFFKNNLFEEEQEVRAVFSRENHAINKELLKKMIREGHPEKSIIEIEEIVEDLFNENKECNKELNYFIIYIKPVFRKILWL